jgi:hypothetical protein
VRTRGGGKRATVHAAIFINLMRAGFFLYMQVPVDFV